MDPIDVIRAAIWVLCVALSLSVMTTRKRRIRQ